MQPRRSVAVILLLSMICLHLGSAGATLGVPAPLAATIRVAPSGSDNPGCGSAASPCKTIQYAVNKTSPGDTILVAEGVHTLDPSSNDCQAQVGAAAVVCAQDPEITILGGYSTSDWTLADPSAHVTIIDGRDSYRGVLLVGSGPTTNFRMEGFTIRNCLARGINTRPGDDGIFAHGGGMFVDLGYPPVSTKRVVLRNLIFKNNRAIGDDHSPYGGTGHGGGLALRSVINATLEYLTFEGNEARGGNGTDRGGYAIGGGFHTAHSNVTVAHVRLVNNIARGGNATGSGRLGSELADGLGGGAGTHGINLALEHVFAQGNQAIGGNARDAGGCGAGGALLAEGATLSLSDAELRDNTAIGGDAQNGGLAGGGAIDAYNSNLLVKRTYVIANRAQGGKSTTGAGKSGQPGGGGIYVVRFSGNTVFQIENSIIADNVLAFGQAGSTSVGGGGGGIWLQGAQAYINHTTIVRNRLSAPPMVGNAILLLGFDAPTPATAQINYSIIADHTDTSGVSALYVIRGNAAYLNYTLWAGNHKDTNVDGWEKPTIVDSDPVRVPSAGFVSPGPPAYDYHVTADSPARNEAIGSSMPEDVDGESRGSGADPDIGADEYLSPEITLGNPRPGDGTLNLRWQATLIPATELDHYALLVSCEHGANPPAEGECDSAINVGLQTSYPLTGLTNGMAYTLTVEARNSSGAPIVTSNTVTGIPRILDFAVYLPLVCHNH